MSAMMNRLRFLLLGMIALLVSCATISEKSRMDRFSDISESYRFALLRADYRLASSFVDPPERNTIDPNHLKEIKIVDYKPNRVNLSEDKSQIKQDIELQYFLLGRNVLRSVQYQQVWQYQEIGNMWLLKTDLPPLVP
jgi:hypothetical protein